MLDNRRVCENPRHSLQVKRPTNMSAFRMDGGVERAPVGGEAATSAQEAKVHGAHLEVQEAAAVVAVDSDLLKVMTRLDRRKGEISSTILKTRAHARTHARTHACTNQERTGRKAHQ
jgi:hypothetical protein